MTLTLLQASMTQFSTFQLHPHLEKAIVGLNFTAPTPIQAKAIPIALEGRDLIACAQTGSGKTAAFAVPLLNKLINNEDLSTRALILAPTRELATQIADVITKLTSHARQIQTAVLIGGADMHKQLRALQRNPKVIIATPGRLMDHLRRRSISLQKTEFLVLDEGDRMLDMGFAPQLDEILKFLPQKRQTLLFTATLPPNVQKLAQKYLRNPIQVSVGAISQPVDRIKQTAIQITDQTKDSVLLDELNARQGSVIIFTRTQRRTDRLARYLNEFGYTVSLIHGGRSQGQRNSAMKGFRSGQFRILVATDLAARGLDVPEIAHVINYDLPMMDEDYVHRIGRTARAGANGEALSLLLPQDRNQWFKLARKYNIKGVDIPAPQKSHKKHGPKRSFGKPSKYKNPHKNFARA